VIVQDLWGHGVIFHGTVKHPLGPLEGSGIFTGTKLGREKGVQKTLSDS